MAAGSDVPGSATRIDRAREWSAWLLLLTSGLLLFETISGLAAWLLPFGALAQHVVLLHVLAGLVFVPPFAWYAGRHWLGYRRHGLTHYKTSGYVSLGILVALIVSGLVLTAQAAFGSRISYGWDRVHLVTTLAVVPFLVLHVVLLFVRDARSRAESLGPVVAAQRRFRLRVVALSLAPCLVAIAAWRLAPGYRWTNELPADYAMPFGPERPFAPSLATTTTGGAFDDMSLAGSERCGTTRCHEQIAAEWSVSAHRWAALDTAFQAIQKVMGDQNGPESTRYCGGCHDPVSLFSGVKDLTANDLTGRVGYHEGVSCLSCHAIRETDVKGNAAYVMAQPDRYLWELSDSRAGKFASDFLIRAYPKHHVDQLAKRLFKTPEYCAACHKQFIDQEVNRVGWVQLQNQYDNWKNSRWNHPEDPSRTIECRECHMRLVDSTDPAAGDDADPNRNARDGKHRSHRFIGANQYLPRLLDLPGWQEQVKQTEEWLRGETEIPEIASKWAAGPAVPIEIEVPEQVEAGGRIPVKVVLTSNKVGHDFPTGPLDIIQSWVELTVTDERGKEIFHSGRVDDSNFVEPGTFMFKAEPVDQFGNLIDRHNLWEMVGVRFRRSLFPGFSDAATYDVPCPGGSVTPVPDLPRTEAHEVALPEGATGTLTVRAKLRYRKIDQFLLNHMFGENAGLSATITDISEDVATVRVIQETPSSKASSRSGF